MKKLIIYPFIKQTVSLLYTLQIENPVLFEIVELYGIIPDSIANQDMDISEITNRKSQINIRLITLDFKSLFCDNEVFLQLPCENSPANNLFINTVQSRIKENGLKIYTSPVEALKACGYFPQNKKYSFEDFQLHRPTLSSINVPIIGICSVFPFSDTSEITAKLKEYLSHGIHISTVYTNSIHNGWVHNYIDVEFLKNLPFETRIFYVNWYLNQVVKNEESSILIVEIPNAVMGLNMRYLMGGGEFPFIFSQAADFDYVICCVPANEITDYPFLYLEKHLQTRYAMRHISFHVSNQHFFLEKESYNDSIPYMLVDSDYIDKKILEVRKSDPNLRLFNLTNESDIVMWRKMK